MTAAGYYAPGACRVDDLRALLARETAAAEVPQAARIVQQVPIYDGAALRAGIGTAQARRRLMAEWAGILRTGAGVFVIEKAVSDPDLIDAVTRIYLDIIEAQRREAGPGGDHFAAAGANDRIWNSLQKLCFADPALYARYFGNVLLDAAAEAWLGPGYQMTAQVNLVRPGGAAQEAHRDYHLGFQSAAHAADFPSHIHDLSPALTLQGGIAHCDMPVESGPTRLLPFSQLYGPGYLAFREPGFRALFDDHALQLPLAKGDAVFFNPALFHAAGENRSSDIQRMANLLQVSSAFGRAMEAIDRSAMCAHLYPALIELVRSNALGPAQAKAAIAATAEGYAFPTNLDTDPPIGGLAPETQAALLNRALADDMAPDALVAALSEQQARRLA